MIIAFCIMSYYAALDKSDLLRIFSLVILICTSAIFPIMILRIVFAKLPEFPTISSLVISKVSSYFDNINQLFSKRGIWWSISPELYIEMSIEQDDIQDDIQDVIEEENSDEIEPNQSNYEENKSRRRKIYQPINVKQEDVVEYDSKRSSKKKSNKRIDPICSTEEPIVSLKNVESPSKLSEQDESKSKPLVMKKSTTVKNQYEQDTFSKKISAMDPNNNSVLNKDNANVSRNIQSQNKTMDKTKITYPSYSNPEAILENNIKLRDTPVKELEDMEEDMYK